MGTCRLGLCDGEASGMIMFTLGCVGFSHFLSCPWLDATSSATLLFASCTLLLGSPGVPFASMPRLLCSSLSRSWARGDRQGWA